MLADRADDRAELRREGPGLSRPARFGVVGFGRIGRRLVERLPGTPDAPVLAALLVRPDDRPAAEACAPAETVCTDLDAFIARRPDVAVECASAATLAALGPRLLASGIDLIPLSLAALADEAVEARLLGAARAGPGRLEIAPGAVGSLDLIAAAREDDLARVVFRAAYPVSRWRGTAAEGMADLDAVRTRTVLCRSSVRAIARLFPRHVNVAVGVALAGLGLDRTDAELIADPSITQAAFEVDIAAGPGHASLRVGGRAIPTDQDPVDYTTFSVMRLLRRRQARIVL